MARTRVIFYQEEPDEVPALDWLKELRRSNKAAYAKCVARVERLAELGHELRRPEADYLRDGIYELRAKLGRLNFRLLYFFHGQLAAVLAHGLTKEDKVPDADVDRAIRRKQKFLRQPAVHTYEEVLT